mmetsp:Transcript_15140/g.22506  ORF Transcript_15140/g.22506 Transcript_15140/m.22506 type:complete len:277 (-) Transcript_15140:102-932(-)
MMPGFKRIIWCQILAICLNKVLALIPTEPPCPSNSSIETQKLVNLFVGEFDNYDQARLDLKKKMPPGEKGGHEHIHCSLKKIDSGIDLRDPSESNDSRHLTISAHYYFDGDPQKTFRYRIYSFQPQSTYSKKKNAMMCISTMKIFKLNSSSEKMLKNHNYELCSFIQEKGAVGLKDLYYIEGCDIEWFKNLKFLKRNLYFGKMASGEGAWIDSQRNPGEKILIKDDIKLQRNKILLNDRGYNIDGKMVYGNSKGIPYEMKRVIKSLKDRLKNVKND